MLSRLGLRCVDPAFSSMRNALLAQPTKHVRLARLRALTRYAAFETSLDGKPCRTYLNAQDLLDYWLDDTSLPVDQLEPTVLRRLVEDCYRVDGPPDLMDGLAWHAVEDVHPGADIETYLFHVSTDLFDLWVDRLPLACCLPPALPPPDLYAALTWKLHGPALTAADLAQIERGDAIRLPDGMGALLAGTLTIAAFRLEGNHLMIEHRQELAALAVDECTDLPCAPQDLPVQLAFHLTAPAMTVAQVAALAPGATVSLPTAHPQVTIVSGSRIVARGELVRVGDMLAVELSEVLIAQQNVDAESVDDL